MSKPAKAQNPKPEWGFFAMIPRIVRTKYPELGASEKWLYTCLKDLCGDKGACFRTLPTLSEETGLSTGSLSAMIPALHDAGLIHATKKSRGLGGKKVWYITIVDIWGSNKEYCSNSEQSQNDTIQNLNNTPKSSTRVIQNMNDVVQDLNKDPEYSSNSETSCSNFVDRRRTIEEEQREKQEEEGTYPRESQSDVSALLSQSPAHTQFTFQVQGFSQFYHDFCIHAQDRGINDGLTLIVKNLNDIPQDAECQICYKPVHGTHGYGELPAPALSQSEIAEQIRSRIPEGDAILLERLNDNSHCIYRKSGRPIGELIPVGVDVSDGLLELITVDATPFVPDWLAKEHTPSQPKTTREEIQAANVRVSEMQSTVDEHGAALQEDSPDEDRNECEENMISTTITVSSIIIHKDDPDERRTGKVLEIDATGEQALVLWFGGHVPHWSSLENMILFSEWCVTHQTRQIQHTGRPGRKPYPKLAQPGEPVAMAIGKTEQKGETHVTIPARGGHTDRDGHHSTDPGKQSLPAQNQPCADKPNRSTAQKDTGTRTRKAKVAPEFTEQGRKVYDAWCSLFKSPPRAAEKTIECADALYPLLVPWCKELKVSCAALLDEIQKHMYATDTNKFYKRGITLCDVERDFEKWQSAKTQESSKGNGSAKKRIPTREEDPYSIAALIAEQNPGYFA